jgi:hypothetical protein
MVFPFLPCSSTCVTGQTGSEKTRFVFQLLKTVKDMYVEDPPNEIMYCFRIHQPLFEEMEKTIPSITGSYRRIHGRQTSPTDRVGRFDVPSRTERGHGMSPPQTERRVHHTERFPQRNEIENHRIKHDISRHDEKHKGRHAGETTLSRTLQDIDVRFIQRHFASVRSWTCHITRKTPTD